MISQLTRSLRTPCSMLLVASLLSSVSAAPAPITKRAIAGSGLSKWHNFEDNIAGTKASLGDRWAEGSFLKCGMGLPGINNWGQLAQVASGNFNTDCYQCVKVQANGKTAYVRAVGIAATLEIGQSTKALLGVGDTYDASWSSAPDAECNANGVDPWDRKTCPALPDGTFKPLYITEAGGYCS